MEQHTNFLRTQQAWDAVAIGDYMTAINDYAEDIIVDNGPGAGPYRHVEGRDAYIAAAFEFIPLFGDTWSQHGTCLHADDACSITLVHETGTAASGDTFDNRALWVNRFGSDGKVDRLWTIDLDTEAVEAFWHRNPIVPTTGPHP